MNFETIREKLLQLDTACLCDASKQVRLMEFAMRPLQSGLKLIGKAHTVVCEDDFLTVIKGLHDAQAGEVLVVDTRDSRRAVAGELFANEALRKGLAGIVVDGAVRDSEKIRALSLPVYSRSITPVAGTTQKIFETQVSIRCGGVEVNPGDVIFGDDDGIVVASEEELAELIPVAENIQLAEDRALIHMNGGESLLEMINFEEHYQALQQGRDSQLKFA